MQSGLGKNHHWEIYRKQQVDQFWVCGWVFDQDCHSFQFVTLQSSLGLHSKFSKNKSFLEWIDSVFFSDSQDLMISSLRTKPCLIFVAPILSSRLGAEWSLHVEFGWMGIWTFFSERRGRAAEKEELREKSLDMGGRRWSALLRYLTRG